MKGDLHWPVVPLQDLAAKIDYGLTARATSSGEGPKFLRITDIQNDRVDWSNVPLCSCKEKQREKYALMPGDIVFARTGATTGKSFLVRSCPQGAVFASYLIRLKIRSENLSPYYLLYSLMSRRYQGYITGASTGTTRRSASAGVITDFDVVIPPENLRQDFERRVTVLRRSLNNLLTRNAVLRRTRDLLLPRLISGQVDVSDLDIETGGLEEM